MENPYTMPRAAAVPRDSVLSVFDRNESLEKKYFETTRHRQGELVARRARTAGWGTGIDQFSFLGGEGRIPTQFNSDTLGEGTIGYNTSRVRTIYTPLVRSQNAGKRALDRQAHIDSRESQEWRVSPSAMMEKNDPLAGRIMQHVPLPRVPTETTVTSVMRFAMQDRKA